MGSPSQILEQLDESCRNVRIGSLADTFRKYRIKQTNFNIDKRMAEENAR